MAEYIGYGGNLKIDNVALAQVVDIDGMGWKCDMAEANHLDIPDGFERVTPKLAKAEPMTFNLIFDGANMGVVFGLARTEATFSYTSVDTSEYVFDGYITSVKWGAPLNDVQTVDVEVQPQGKPTFE